MRNIRSDFSGYKRDFPVQQTSLRKSKNRLNQATEQHSAIVRILGLIMLSLQRYLFVIFLSVLSSYPQFSDYWKQIKTQWDMGIYGEI